MTNKDDRKQCHWQDSVSDAVLETPEPDKWIEVDGNPRPLPMFFMATLMRYGENCAEAGMSSITPSVISADAPALEVVATCHSEPLRGDESQHRFTVKWKTPQPISGDLVILAAAQAAVAAAKIRPAPCHHACEAQAFKIEIRQKDQRIAKLESALRQARDALDVATNSIGSFTSDEGCSEQDFDNMDTALSVIAAIDGVLRPTVQFLPVDDTEGGHFD